MKNPIIDNRIVSDITFALRFKNFIKDVEVNDLASEEEKSYLLSIASDLLHYQISTLVDDSEKKYLMNNRVIRPKRSSKELKDIISKLPRNKKLRVTHIKTDNPYVVLSIIKNCTNAVDGQEMVIYQDFSGNEYCRELEEFIQKFKW